MMTIQAANRFAAMWLVVGVAVCSGSALLAQGPLGGMRERLGSGNLFGGKNANNGGTQPNNPNAAPAQQQAPQQPPQQQAAQQAPQQGKKGGFGGGSFGAGRIVDGPQFGAAAFAPGSADAAVQGFVNALEENDTATASDFITPRLKSGLLGQMREGELSEEKIEELRSVISSWKDLRAQQVPPHWPKRTYLNPNNQRIEFALKKEKDSYTISGLTYTPLPKR